MKRCFIDNSDGDSGKLWPLFKQQVSDFDDVQKTAHAAFLGDLDGNDDNAQVVAEAILRAAYTAECIYNHLPLTKMLLEKATEVFDFPEGFMQSITPTIKIEGNKTAKPKASSSGTTASASAPLPTEEKKDEHDDSVDTTLSGGRDLTFRPAAAGTTLPGPASYSNVAASGAPPTTGHVGQPGSAAQAGSAAAPDNSGTTPADPAVPLGGPTASSNTPAPSPNTKSVTELHAKRPNKVQANVTLLTNHFSVAIEANKVLYEYEIQGLEGHNLTKPKKKVLIERMIEYSPFLHHQRANFATDYDRKVIAWKDLSILDDHLAIAADNVVDSQRIPDYDRTQNNVPSTHYYLNLVHTRLIDLEGLKNFVDGKYEHYRETGAAQAMNILIGRGVSDSDTRVFRVGDKRFFTPADSHDFNQHGLIAIRGFYSSIRAGEGQILLNVNNVVSAFYKAQPVSDYIDMYNNFAENEFAQKHLIGLRVRIRYNRCKHNETDRSKDTEERRKKTITGFSEEVVLKTYFDRNGTSVSVWEHFRTTYPNAARGRTGDQLCVNTSSTTTGEDCWFLADQLDVLEGQLYRCTLEKLSPRSGEINMTTQMIDFACRKPRENRQAIIHHGLPALALHDPNNPPHVLARSGIRIGTQMMEVQSKIIAAPRIVYAGGGRVQPDGASWATHGKSFLNTAKTINGSVLFCRPRDVKLKYPEMIIANFKHAYHRNGIKVAKNIPERFVEIPRFDVLQLRDQLSQGTGVGLFVLVLPHQDATNRSRHA